LIKRDTRCCLRHTAGPSPNRKVRSRWAHRSSRAAEEAGPGPRFGKNTNRGAASCHLYHDDTGLDGPAKNRLFALPATCQYAQSRPLAEHLPRAFQSGGRPRGTPYAARYKLNLKSRKHRSAFTGPDHTASLPGDQTASATTALLLWRGWVFFLHEYRAILDMPHTTEWGGGGVIVLTWVVPSGTMPRMWVYPGSTCPSPSRAFFFPMHWGVVFNDAVTCGKGAPHPPGSQPLGWPATPWRASPLQNHARGKCAYHPPCAIHTSTPQAGEWQPVRI